MQEGASSRRRRNDTPEKVCGSEKKPARSAGAAASPLPAAVPRGRVASRRPTTPPPCVNRIGSGTALLSDSWLRVFSILHLLRLAKLELRHVVNDRGLGEEVICNHL